MDEEEALKKGDIASITLFPVQRRLPFKALPNTFSLGFLPSYDEFRGPINHGASQKPERKNRGREGPEGSGKKQSAKKGGKYQKEKEKEEI